MSAGRTVAAARVIVAAWERGPSTADAAAEALESACLLQDPETARELDALRARVAELETTPARSAVLAEAMAAIEDRACDSDFTEDQLYTTGLRSAGDIVRYLAAQRGDAS